MTAAELIRELTLLLRRGGLEVPRLEAELILSHLWGGNRTALLIKTDDQLPPEVEREARLLTARRLDGMPLAYLTGEREFMSLSFLVSPAVLIPRPETELLVEYLLRWLREREQPLLADVGTGSGAIAVSLAYYQPEARLMATDRSSAALAVAAENAARHGVDGQIAFLEGDLLQPVLKRGIIGRGTAVAANLPYIPSRLLSSLPPDVRREPRIALDGGADGLALYRRLLPQAEAFLVSGGLLAAEIGYDQGEKISALLNRRGWRDVKILKDYAGLNRIATGIRPSGRLSRAGGTGHPDV